VSTPQNYAFYGVIFIVQLVVDREHNQKQTKTIQRLEKDLARKEKALAEVAALLVLQKKFQALMEASEVD